MNFLAKYFARSWGLEILPDQSTETILKNVRDAKSRPGKKEMLTQSAVKSIGEAVQNNLKGSENIGKRIMELLEQVIQKESPRMEKNQVLQNGENNNNVSSSDPIVYFNVEGEIIPILKSTIIRVVPKSQLAARVSGQTSLGDVDEEGNLIVDCDKAWLPYKFIIPHERKTVLWRSL
jgi:hypothetical protein